MKSSLIRKIFVIISLLTCQQMIAHDFEVNGIYYGLSIFNKNTAYVTHKGADYVEFDEYSGSIVIPESVTYKGKTYKVQSIGGYAFSGCTGLTSVTLPNSIVEIHKNAFEQSSLESIIIPETVKTIHNQAFASCYNLKCVELKHTTPPAYNDLFAGISIEQIRLKVPFSSYYTYKGTEGWNSLTLANYNVNGIYYSPINQNEVKVTYRNILDSGNTYYNSYSGNVTIPADVTIDGYKCTVSAIDENAFCESTELKSVTINNIIETIPECAFSSCTNLTSVKIGNNVKRIEGSAFHDCHSLDNVVIPDNVTYIGGFSFCDCGAMKNLTLGVKVSNIAGYAFYNCTGLTNISILNPTPPTCESNVFYNVNMTNISLSVPYGSVSNYQSVEPWKNFKISGANLQPSVPSTDVLTYNIINSTDVEVVAGTEKYTGDIVIPSTTVIDGTTYNVTKIGERAFYNCSGLTSVIIPNSVTGIDDFAFYSCTGLTSITIPNSVTSIGYYAFSSCTGLESIIVESGNTVYDSRDNCNAIIETSTNKLVSGCKNTIIPNSVTGIGDFAFYGCTGLTSIEIPNSVTWIGNYAFSYCTGLTSIEIPNSVTWIGNYAFDNCTGLTNVTIPNRVTGIDAYAFSSCTGLTNVTIPNSVTGIDDLAFYSCTGLTSITIPNSVTSIGEAAFAYCDGLTSITSLNPTPPTCGTDVFYGVDVANIPLTVPSGSESQYQSADVWKDFGTITGIKEESGVITDPVITKLWTVPKDYEMVRTATGFGDTFFGADNTAGAIEEWKDGQLVASYDVNGFCAVNQLGEMVQTSDGTGNVTEKFQSYVLWTGIMVDDAGNLLVNVGLGVGSATTCQNWVLLPAEDRTKMQLLHIDEFPSADVTLGRVDVPSRIIGNITDGGAYLYVTPNQSTLMPVMFIGLNDEGKIFYDLDLSWALMSSVPFDTSTNVATFQTFDDLVNATTEEDFVVNTYVRWRGQRAPFTWNADAVQFEINTAIPIGASAAGMDVFKLGGVEYIVLPINSVSTGTKGYSIGVYNLADGSEVATWDAGTTTSSYVGSIQVRVNADGRSANIYVCGWSEYIGILRFGSASSVSSLGGNSLNSGAGSSAIEEVTSAETEGEVEYYNLQGVRVMNPGRGLYIKRQGGKTTKIKL